MYEYVISPHLAASIPKQFLCCFTHSHHATVIEKVQERYQCQAFLGRPGLKAEGAGVYDDQRPSGHVFAEAFGHQLLQIRLACHSTQLSDESEKSGHPPTIRYTLPSMTCPLPSGPLHPPSVSRSSATAFPCTLPASSCWTEMSWGHISG